MQAWLTPLRLTLLALVATVLAACPPAPAPTLDPVRFGELVITEIAPDPTSAGREWLELLNVTDHDLTMVGCTLRPRGGEDDEVDLPGTFEVHEGEYVLVGELAFLGSLPGDDRVDIVVRDISFAQDAREETVELLCPNGNGELELVASETYNWDAEGMRGGHSRQLTSDPYAAAEDVEGRTWCEAPIEDEAVYYEFNDEDGSVDIEYGTPRTGPLCQTLGTMPDASGQILFTEILVAAVSGVVDEWFELHNPGEQALDLHGCVLEDRPHPGGSHDASIRSHRLDTERGATIIEAGGYLLLGKVSGNDDLPATLLEEGVNLLDPKQAWTIGYPYTTLSFGNSDLRSLALQCPGDAGLVPIDEIAYEWSDLSGDFKGYTWSLDPLALAGALTAEANDDFAAWCPADGAAPYASVEEEAEGDDDDSAEAFVHHLYGTPGAANSSCPEPLPWPIEDDVIITEINGRAYGNSDEEWFEVYNDGAAIFELAGCRLFNDNLTEGGSDTPADIAPTSGTLPIEPGEFLVFTKSTTSSSVEDWGLPWDFQYSGINFSNGDPESLELYCPTNDGLGGELLIDRITYEDDFVAGWSNQLRASAFHAPHADLGDPDSWCAADPELITYPWMAIPEPLEDPDEINYGTPGEGPICD
jgi:hypothetical protein